MSLNVCISVYELITIKEIITQKKKIELNISHH